MDDGITSFYVQAIGSSHVTSGKPCQDYGVTYSDHGIHIAVVCDGHGGDSYVRSDVGAHLAAEIAKDEILRFIETDSSLFKGKTGCVPPSVITVPRKDQLGRIIRKVEDLSETELEQLKQSNQYITESKKFQKIEFAMRQLFSDICNSWKKAITEDAKKRPFSKKEKDKLGFLKLEKAFGTTLMAAVRTPDYWFAFHIGDGKLYSCDNLMGWKEPVPWDCNCFLNVTTSLCGSHPVDEFRYAFDGTGNFPVAFVLGSDGIDDTFVTKENIEKFYSRMLTLFDERGKDELIRLLENQLPILSSKGSHDDMSVAAIIDGSLLPTAVDYYNNILSKVRALTVERKRRQNEIDRLELDICELRTKYEEISTKRDKEASANWNWWTGILRQREKMWHCCKQLSEEAYALHDRITELNSVLASQKEDFSNWEAESRSQVKVLRDKAKTIEDKVSNNQSVSRQQSETAPSIISDCRDSQIEPVSDYSHETDAPGYVSEKASQSMMTEEDIERMNEAADKQTKEILNDNYK